MTENERKPPTDGKPGFEESMDRLEKIVGEMEDGTLSLEEMIGRFEEGRALIKTCTRTLNEVERKIEMLVKKDDDIVAVPFDEAEGKEELF